MGDRLHLEPFSGLAGDMFLGACLDLGMPVSVVEEAVSALDLPGVGVEAWPDGRGGVTGTRFRVLVDGRPLEGAEPGREEASDHPDGHPGHHPHHSHPPDHEGDPAPEPSHGRSLADIRRLIGDSDLPAAVRERALGLFARLGEAEGRVHGVPPDRVHFHEVGAVDSIVDLVGAAAAIEHLAPARVTCGPVNVGGGTVATAHGELPVPAPATALLIRGLPVYGGAWGELLTPTGAVLLAELVDEFRDGLPAMVVEAVGYGLGRREVRGRPNAVRLLRGREATAEAAPGTAVVLEAEIDDLPAEAFGFLVERLFEGGALDVYLTPVQMKKGRPGTLVTALCRPADRPALAERLVLESGSLGCRWYEVQRLEAERSSGMVATPWGEVGVKRGSLGGRPFVAAPEYDDCRRVALAAGRPWREVWLAALRAAEAERK
jgi:hypothetical protein